MHRSFPFSLIPSLFHQIESGLGISTYVFPCQSRTLRADFSLVSLLVIHPDLSATPCLGCLADCIRMYVVHGMCRLSSRNGHLRPAEDVIGNVVLKCKDSTQGNRKCPSPLISFGFQPVDVVVSADTRVRCHCSLNHHLNILTSCRRCSRICCLRSRA